MARSLEGHYRQEHLFALKQAVELVEFYQQQITGCDCQIEACLQQFEQKSTETAVSTRRRKRRRGQIGFDAHSYLYRMTGVDLTQIDSIEVNTALTVIGEIGLDMSRWPTENISARGSVWLPAARSPVANASVAVPNPRRTELRQPYVWQHSPSTKVSRPLVRTSVASKLVSVRPRRSRRPLTN